MINVHLHFVYIENGVLSGKFAKYVRNFKMTEVIGKGFKSFIIAIVSFSIRILYECNIDIKNSLTLPTFKAIQSRMTEMKV